MNFNQFLGGLAHEFDELIVLDSHGYPDKFSRFNRMIAAGAYRKLKLLTHQNAFEQLETFVKEAHLPVFIAMAYDLKNDTEELASHNEDICETPLLIAVEPIWVCYTSKGQQHFAQQPGLNKITPISQNIDLFQYQKSTVQTSNTLFISTPKSKYLQNFLNIKTHIQRGNIYEMNYCICLRNYDITLNPIETFCNLSSHSPAPFSAYFKSENHHIICSSPERYLRKSGQRLISQPIKGTARRHINEIKDQKAKQALSESEKERNENVMIVDLVRNDLSRVAQKSSVHVIELFGIYSFSKVHQMISTIEAQIKEGITLKDIFKATFPMGSMTGAPKINAMKYAEEYEDFMRGFYSGSIGYIWPNGDFDMNVVIRSLIYNHTKKSAYIGAGSAITALADAESEYQECLLKAEAIINAIVYDSE